MINRLPWKEIRQALEARIDRDPDFRRQLREETLSLLTISARLEPNGQDVRVRPRTPNGKWVSLAELFRLMDLPEFVWTREKVQVLSRYLREK